MLVGDNLKSACAALISASVIIFAYAKVSNTEVTSVLAQLFHVVVEPLRWLLWAAPTPVADPQHCRNVSLAASRAKFIDATAVGGRSQPALASSFLPDTLVFPGCQRQPRPILQRCCSATSCQPRLTAGHSWVLARMPRTVQGIGNSLSIRGALSRQPETRMKDGASGAAAFVAARDFLLRHRADYDRAYGNLPGRNSAISTGRSTTSTSWLGKRQPRTLDCGQPR
jgi:hypothetical protein